MSYNVVELVQGTEEWLEWRKEKITATTATVIIGSNPYRRVEQLWGELKGTEPPQEVNWAMQRGSRLEPYAAAMFSETFAEFMTPMCVENASEPWIAASLDGLSMDGTFAVEIKVPSAKTIEDAEKGIVPQHYYDQIQWQHLATGNSLDHIKYVVFESLGDTELRMIQPIEVRPDTTRQAELYKACRSFKSKLDNGLDLFADDWQTCAENWLYLGDQINKLEAYRAIYTERLQSIGMESLDKTTEIRGVRITVKNGKADTVSWKGVVDYLAQHGLDSKLLDEAITQCTTKGDPNLKSIALGVSKKSASAILEEMDKRFAKQGEQAHPVYKVVQKAVADSANVKEMSIPLKW